MAAFVIVADYQHRCLADTPGLFDDSRSSVAWQEPLILYKSVLYDGHIGIKRFRIVHRQSWE
jgi:hypothetical protein